MSKHPSQEAYEKAKAKHKQRALEKEKMIKEDLYALRREFIPKHLKRKFLTGCAVFATVYLTEELIFRKKVPGIIKFTGALAATFMAPKLYSFLQDHYLQTAEPTVLEEAPPTLPVASETTVTEPKGSMETWESEEDVENNFPEKE